MAPLRVLIVDDEPLARARLEDLLAEEAGVAIVGTADDGDEAVDAIARLRPDLVFLDVQMPGRTGVEVIEAVGVDAMPATIFVTAYDAYALAAFEVAAVDYLVKPYDDARFRQAFRRARDRLALEGVRRLRGQLLRMLQAADVADDGQAATSGAPTSDASTSGAPGPSATGPGATRPGTAGPPYQERIAVEIRGRLRPIAVADIDVITASGIYAELHVGDRRYLIRETMQTLEERLDPARFMRVHRSVIVRLALVESLARTEGGEYEVQLRGGGRLKVARSRRAALERWLGVSS
ncbi:DNA-binding response regulator [Gemmatimonadetes bacterium T265]|nr:DNA-binding response regulator [Gemmatimonadetes bacterium T265]